MLRQTNFRAPIIKMIFNSNLAMEDIEKIIKKYDPLADETIIKTVLVYYH
jgi:hypothetical protein